jgi:NAD(P)-dependent dehydrogenase (short-subunit alcohol dehydrogenase family)
MTKRLENKVAIVTGGSRGIGYATVEALQSVAGDLAVVSEKVGKLENDYTEVNSNIINIKAAVGDITKLYDYETNARTIVDELNDINERLMW